LVSNSQSIGHGGNSLLGGLFEAKPDPSAPTRFGRIYAPEPAWHAEAPVEIILEPDLPIVDAHHHLWDLPGLPYLLPDYLADLNTGHRVVATVFNECHAMWRACGPDEMKPVGEVEFCAGIAAMSESGAYGSTRVNAGIVGHADLTLADRVTPVLEAQIAAGGGRFRGVRHAAAWDADTTIGNSHSSPGPHLYRRPEFREGLKRLSGLGLTLDAYVFHPQLDDVAGLARAVPEVDIILGHMGGPLGSGVAADCRDEVFATWKHGMTALSRCPNVTVKLGGVMMRLASFDYGKSTRPATSEELARRWGPYVLTCIELFGPGRCMVESNFPVEKMGIGYAALFNALKRIAAGLTAEEKSMLFSGTADRIYRLGLTEAVLHTSVPSTGNSLRAPRS
jgi:L-fuconolactonase